MHFEQVIFRCCIFYRILQSDWHCKHFSSAQKTCPNTPDIFFPSPLFGVRKMSGLRDYHKPNATAFCVTTQCNTAKLIINRHGTHAQKIVLSIITLQDCNSMFYGQVKAKQTVAIVVCTGRTKLKVVDIHQEHSCATLHACYCKW